MIFLESTANRRNHFYKLYNQAKVREVDYKARFFSWRDFYTVEEFEKIKLGFSDKTLIAQEFPDNDHECFLAGGGYYFSTSALKLYEIQIKKPIKEIIYPAYAPFKQYRKIEPGEQILIGGDCSQGGKDFNACVFFSKTKLDVPLIYHTRGVAASMTPDIFQIAETIFDITSQHPLIAFESNNGGSSEMERLRILNRLNKYSLFVMPTVGLVTGIENTNRLGYNTNVSSRPILLGDLKNAIDANSIGIYSEEIINELFSFIISKSGKQTADLNANDDLIFALAIALQLHQNASSQMVKPYYPPANDLSQKKWNIGAD